MTEPEALLLDEPFNGVDDPARERLVAGIRAGVRAAERTLVLVTQRRDEALRLAGRLIVVWQGAVRQDGPVEQVLARPADTDVARFLGLDNVLKGRIVGDDADGVIVDLLGIALHVALPSPRPPLGPDVWVVFSPEQVELRAPSATAAASPRNIVPARVASVVPREGRVEVALGAGFAGGLTIVAAVTRPSAVEELALRPGVEVQYGAQGDSAARRPGLTRAHRWLGWSRVRVTGATGAQSRAAIHRCRWLGAAKMARANLAT